MPWFHCTTEQRRLYSGKSDKSASLYFDKKDIFVTGIIIKTIIENPFTSCYNTKSVTSDDKTGFCLQFIKGGTGMKFEKIDCGNGFAVAISSDSIIIVDVDSALDLLMSAKYEAGTKYIVVDKKNIIEDFFILSSGLAGEILQKFINYGGKIAIYGDFSHYTSKPLKDFIFESNKGKDVFFVATKEEAIQKISKSI